MPLEISLPDHIKMKPKILVFGVGGAGCNAVNNMISANLEGIEFWAANTDNQALENMLTNNRIQLGAKSTQGLGAGSYPEVGRAAAEESVNDIKNVLDSCNMVFITAGMGGGTGTGAAPVIARIAKERGILTVGVVTKPFYFEGVRRMKIAELGLEDMQKHVDTLIVIPNQNLFRVANEKTTFADAFKMADNVLHSGVRGVTDLITMPGLINLDFADIRAVMSEMGKAMMGTGEAEGDNRAIFAAEAAISNPLLDNSSMRGARGVLINITGGTDMTLFEVDEAANRIREEIGEDLSNETNIIFGSAFNTNLDGKIRVSVVATGIDSKQNQNQKVSNQNTSSGLFVSEPRSVRISDPETKAAANMQEHQVSAVISNGVFIPPKPVEPSSYNISIGSVKVENSDYSLNEQHKQAVPAAEGINERTLQSSSADPQISLFGRVAASLKGDKESDVAANEEALSQVEKKQKEDFFDIPAFIRRKIS